MPEKISAPYHWFRTKKSPHSFVSSRLISRMDFASHDVPRAEAAY